jgi:cytochrome d ubiquinol oxidase subunit I
VVTGWWTAEVGRQPWVVYGILRTTDAVTPSLRTGDVAFSLAAYVVVYSIIGGFGVRYIYKLLREGPTRPAAPIPGAGAKRPMAYADDGMTATGALVERGETR